MKPVPNGPLYSLYWSCCVKNVTSPQLDGHDYSLWNAFLFLKDRCCRLSDAYHLLVIYIICKSLSFCIQKTLKWQ